MCNLDFIKWQACKGEMFVGRWQLWGREKESDVGDYDWSTVYVYVKTE
jgi:hypothetical protein